MSIPMKEFIIKFLKQRAGQFSCGCIVIFQFVFGKLPFVFGKNEELSLWSQCNSQTLNSVVIPARSYVDSPVDSYS